MPAIVSRLATLAGFLVLAAVACGGGPETNGIEDESAAEVLQAAADALENAKSVHVTGTSTSAGQPAEVDLRIQDGSSDGTITIEGTRLEITTVDSSLFVMGDHEALETLGVPPEAARLGADRWLELSPQQAGLEGFSLDSLAAEVASTDSPLEPTVEQTELDDEQVVVISQQDGSKLYVANTGTAYPLRAESKGQEPGRLDFTEYGADFHITAPQGPVELGELIWLDAVEKLSASMDKVFAEIPTELTPFAMASLGEQLRSCSRELAEIESPSARLQPAHALVEQACAEFDKGAECFATAARIGIPLAESAAEREQSQALDCGFASSGKGGMPMADALIQGTEITGPGN
jgi:hypothetical protein